MISQVLSGIWVSNMTLTSTGLKLQRRLLINFRIRWDYQNENNNHR